MGMRLECKLIILVITLFISGTYCGEISILFAQKYDEQKLLQLFQVSNYCISNVSTISQLARFDCCVANEQAWYVLRYRGYYSLRSNIASASTGYLQ